MFLMSQNNFKRKRTNWKFINKDYRIVLINNDKKLMSSILK